MTRTRKNCSHRLKDCKESDIDTKPSDCAISLNKWTVTSTLALNMIIRHDKEIAGLEAMLLMGQDQGKRGAAFLTFTPTHPIPSRNPIDLEYTRCSADYSPETVKRRMRELWEEFPGGLWADVESQDLRRANECRSYVKSILSWSAVGLALLSGAGLTAVFGGSFAYVSLPLASLALIPGIFMLGHSKGYAGVTNHLESERLRLYQEANLETMNRAIKNRVRNAHPRLAVSELIGNYIHCGYQPEHTLRLLAREFYEIDRFKESAMIAAQGAVKNDPYCQALLGWSFLEMPDTKHRAPYWLASALERKHDLFVFEDTEYNNPVLKEFIEQSLIQQKPTESLYPPLGTSLSQVSVSRSTIKCIEAKMLLEGFRLTDVNRDWYLQRMTCAILEARRVNGGILNFPKVGYYDPDQKEWVEEK